MLGAGDTPENKIESLCKSPSSVMGDKDTQGVWSWD